MAVNPQRNVANNVIVVDKCNEVLPGFACILETLITDKKAKEALPPVAISIYLVKLYFKMLKSDEDPAILIVAQDSHAICLIMLTIDRKNDVESIVDSGSQIISIAADVTNELDIIYT